MSNYQILPNTSDALRLAYEQYKRDGIAPNQLTFFLPLLPKTMAAMPLDTTETESTKSFYAYDIKSDTSKVLENIQSNVSRDITNIKASPALNAGNTCLIYQKPVWWHQVAYLLGLDNVLGLPKPEFFLDLTIEDAKGKRKVRINSPITTVGASKEADLELFIDTKPRYVSKAHAQIVYNPISQLWFVVNISSHRPIFVNNGQQINQPQAFIALPAQGSIIKFGSLENNTNLFPKMTIIALTDDTVTK